MYALLGFPRNSHSVNCFKERDVLKRTMEILSIHGFSVEEINMAER